MEARATSGRVVALATRVFRSESVLFGALPTDTVRIAERSIEAALLAMLRAAIAQRMGGEAARERVLDPSSGRPFEFRAEPDGGFTRTIDSARSASRRS
jgi:hypothetical protein